MLAACSDRYGAYFAIDGRGAIDFDRVELYFGKIAGEQVPVPPGRTSMEPEPGLLVRRLVADSDSVTLAERVDATTYFVPPGGDNDKLGDYLLVIAYKGETPVGMAELFDFEIPTDDVVYKYEVPLVAYAPQEIEIWGRPTPDCIRWNHDRGSKPKTVAMVRTNDVDCDAFVDRNDPALDCEPLRYCDGTGGAGCLGTVACLADDNGCRIGTCLNKDGLQSSCTPTTCVLDAVCSGCDLSASPREQLECVLFENGHVDYPITVMPSQALCTEPYKVLLELPTGVSCGNPMVEAWANWLDGGTFDFDIAGTGSTCLLTITPTVTGAKLDGIPHILISVDSPGGATARQMFIIGLTTQVDLCSDQQTVSVVPTSFGCVP